MSWVDKVPTWVISLLVGYAIPDDATIQTGVDFSSFEDIDGAEVSSSDQYMGAYPGTVPSYALEPIVTPQTNGVAYVLKAKKAVGFYACKTRVVSYEATRINRWTFPMTQCKFGWLTLGRGNSVISESRISFTNQIHTCVPATLLLLNYDDQFDTTNLFNSVDKLTATHVAAQLSPTVKIEFSFLPTWEVWAVKFFQGSQ